MKPGTIVFYAIRLYIHSASITERSVCPMNRAGLQGYKVGGKVSIHLTFTV